MRDNSVVFDQMTALYTLAAALGVHHGLKGELGGSARKSIKWQYFDSNSEVPVLMALAWSVSGRSVEVLQSARKIIDTLEPYVAGGIKYLMEEVLDEYFTPDELLDVPKDKLHPFVLPLLSDLKVASAEAPI